MVVSQRVRCADRVLRVAWSIADIEGRAQLSAEHIGRALYLKKGLAL